jgi:hydrogenase expression/formation protein HypD
VLPRSGLRLTAAFRDMDAEQRFAVTGIRTVEPPECRSGEVLQGLLRPDECSEFGTRCTPDHPLGAPMVSSEGACAAYWKYGRRAAKEPMLPR